LSAIATEASKQYITAVKTLVAEETLDHISTPSVNNALMSTMIIEQWL
jgi:hypothetical protein